jgi:hypothetical protein
MEESEEAAATEAVDAAARKRVMDLDDNIMEVV